MPTVTVVKSPENGKLAGLTDADQRGWDRFLSRVKELGQSCLSITWIEPRSGPYHRRFFAMVGRLFESQEQFDDPDDLRQWLTVGAGHVRFVPGPTGRMVALPVSIKWARMDQAEFEAVANAVWAFAYSEHARRFLWGHLSDEQSYEMLETVLGEFR